MANALAIACVLAATPTTPESTPPSQSAFQMDQPPPPESGSNTCVHPPCVPHIAARCCVAHTYAQGCCSVCHPVWHGKLSFCGYVGTFYLVVGLHGTHAFSYMHNINIVITLCATQAGGLFMGVYGVDTDGTSQWGLYRQENDFAQVGDYLACIMTSSIALQAYQNTQQMQQVCGLMGKICNGKWYIGTGHNRQIQRSDRWHHDVHC